jgi:predicted NBD/HSP70 family sugar kinase
VLEALRQQRIISRTALAVQTHTSRAMVSLVVDEFLRDGLVRAVGPGDSTGGRPPQLIEFVPDAALAPGAALTNSQWNLVLINLDAHVVRRIESPIVGSSPAEAIASLSQGYLRLTADLPPSRLLPALGLGTPGLVDIRTGTIVTAADMGWNDVDMAAMTRKALGLQRVIVANRSRLGALAELWQGAGRGVDSLIYVWVGTGIAAGIVIKGRLFVGANSSAGELGHVTVQPDGPLCPCGNRGCLQQLASGPAIANRARQRLREVPTSLIGSLVGGAPERITAEVVFAAERMGDELAGELIAEAGAHIGLAVANLINLFNPQMVILGGPVGAADESLLTAVQAEVRRRAMAHPLAAAQITRSVLGPDASAIGAGVLVLQRTLGLLRPAERGADGAPAEGADG